MSKDIYYTSNNYNWLRERTDIILLGYSGSLSYGTNISESDIDIRGIFINNPKELLGCYPDSLKYLDSNTDTTLYSFLHVFDMFTSCNPNVLEMLGLRKEDYLVITEVGKLLIDNIEVFLSKQIVSKFGSYARSQINRAMHNIARHSDDKNYLLSNVLRSEQNVVESFNSRYKDYNKGGITVYIKDDELYAKINMDVPVKSLGGMCNEMANTLKEYSKLNHRNRKKTSAELAKHLMHLIRVLIEGYDLLVEHRMITYRATEQEFLLELRNPSSKYYTDGIPNSEFKAVFSYYSDKFDYASTITTLPDSPNLDDLSDLKMKIIKKYI